MDKETYKGTSPGELLKVDPQEAQHFLDQIPMPDKVEFIMGASSRQRQELILLSSHPEQIVAAFPPEELFLTIKEIGTADAVPLISLTTPEQLHFMLDLDWWRKDELRRDKITEWLRILFACGEDKVVSWLNVTDFDLLVLLFKNYVSVFKIETEEGADDIKELASFTVDDCYFIKFEEPQMEDLLRRIVEILREINPGQYFNLMESIIWDIKAETEENAQKWRRERLADQGIPDFYEALDVYRPPMATHKMGTISNVSALRLPYESEPAIEPYPLSLVERHSFVQKALVAISDQETIDRLKREWVNICNNVIVADVADFDDLEGIRRSIQKASGYVNIGLEYISKEQPQRASHMLETVPLLEVFRFGYGQTVALKKKARYILNAGYVKPDFSPAGEPWRSIMEGVLRKHACYYCGLSREKKKAGDYRDFEMLNEIKETLGRLDEIEAVGKLMQCRFPQYLEGLNGLPLDLCNIPMLSDITWINLLFTATTNKLLNKGALFWPIPVAALNNLFPILWSEDPSEGCRKLSPLVKREMEGLLLGPEGECQERDHILAQQYLAMGYKNIEQEMGFLTGPSIEPRYIDVLLVQLSPGHPLHEPVRTH